MSIETVFSQQPFERGEQPKVVNIYCEGHGDLGNVPQSSVQDQINAHREKYGCYYEIKLGKVV